MSPADFADPAIRANDRQRGFQCGRHAGGIDDAVDAESIALLRPGFEAVDDRDASILFGDIQADAIALEADDRDLRALQSRHRGAQNSDWAGAKHDDAVAGLDAS